MLPKGERIFVVRDMGGFLASFMMRKDRCKTLNRGTTLKPLPIYAIMR
jgi:hypothetical protein